MRRQPTFRKLRIARHIRISCVLVGALVLTCSTAFGWGCDGHQTVAAIAFRHLDPSVKARSLELLRQLPRDVQMPHYCKESGLNLFVDVSTWADDIRTKRPETGRWHFIDLPLGTDRPDLKFCDGSSGCVISAIQQQVSVLRNVSAPPAAKAVALLFLIHLSGDLHQPLHTTTNNDKGANCVPVRFFGVVPDEQPPGTWKPNLHSVWDTEQVQKAMNGRSVRQFAEYLDSTFSIQVHSELSRHVNIFNWTWQSHRLGVEVAYGTLPVPVVSEPPIPISSCTDDNNVGQRMSNLHESIELTYFGHSEPVIDLQLVRAGTRLAVMINSLLR